MDEANSSVDRTGDRAQAAPYWKLLLVALSRVLASMGTVPEAMEIKRPVQDKKLSPALTIRCTRRVVSAQPPLVRPSHILA
jgi:hypothetical protein